MESSLIRNSRASDKWTTDRAQLLDERSLKALFAGDIPAIILPGFIAQSSCGVIVENLQRIGMGNYSHVNHAVGRLGLAQMEYHLKCDKAGYFSRVSDAANVYNSAIEFAENPLQKLIQFLGHAQSGGVEIAQDDEFGTYFAGSFRNVMTVGHLHYDFAPFEALGWSVDAIASQLSWNLYLSQPTGGDLHVYNRMYQPSDEALRVSGEYYYEQQIVAGVDQFTYSPRVGDIVIFNCRNFHEVKPVNGDRYSLSSFIGKTKSNDLVLWS